MVHPASRMGKGMNAPDARNSHFCTDRIVFRPIYPIYPDSAKNGMGQNRWEEATA